MNAEKASKLNDAFQGKADAKSVAAGAAAEAVKSDVAPAATEATATSDLNGKRVACRGKQYIELSQNGDKSLAFVSEQLSK